MHLRFKDFFFFWNPVSPKVVRIFTSSTFTDMLMERNTLMEYVYPKIKEYCREKHGLEYQVSVWLCLFLRTFDVMLMSVSLKFQQLLCFYTLGGGHALGCEGRDDWWAHDDGKDFGSIEQCSGVSPYLILICTRLFVWMNCEAVRSTPWAQISSILGLKSRNQCIVFKEREILMFIVYPRYGYRPIPSEIDTAELALLRWYSP